MTVFATIELVIAANARATPGALCACGIFVGILSCWYPYLLCPETNDYCTPDRRDLNNMKSTVHFLHSNNNA